MRANSKKIWSSAIILALICIVTAESGYSATYYVSTGASDSNTCVQAQSLSTGKQTIGAGIGCLTPGDTLYIKGGTYSEFIKLSSFGGTSFDTGIITISAYPGDLVTVKPPATVSGTSLVRFIGVHYIQVLNITFDCFLQSGTDCIGMTDPSNHHIRIKGCEVMNTGRVAGGFGSHSSPFQTNGITASGSFHEFINNKIHDNGNGGYDHGLYVSGSGTQIRGNEIYRNSGYGIHKYPSGDNFSIVGNRVHDNGQSGFLGATNGTGDGILSAGGNANLIANNVSYANYGTGITLQYGETGSSVYNNTVYGNQSPGGYGGISIGSESSNITVKNNIVYGNSGPQLYNSGTASILSNNLTTDPSFVNASAGDFHLRSSSPGINSGIDLSPSVVSDLSDTPRPQGCCYDMGAFEYVSSSASAPSAPANLRVLR
jgi:parallel beta-helix repeat protein